MNEAPTFATYHGKTIHEMSRDELIQAMLDTGATLDRERRSWGRERARLQGQIAGASALLGSVA